MNGNVFDLGYEKWLLLVDNVVEHQGSSLTYDLHFINKNEPLQERKLDLTISYQALATEKKDRHRRPELLRQWIHGWLLENRAVRVLDFDQEVFLQHA
jgi:hypothetical protein